MAKLLRELYYANLYYIDALQQFIVKARKYRAINRCVHIGITLIVWLRDG